MQLTFASLDAWLSRAIERYECPLPDFTLTDGSGRTIAIRPFVVLCRDLALSGYDWIPVYGDGCALLEGMVHVPHHYLHKSPNIVRDGERYVLAREIEPLDEDVVLIGGHPQSYYHWLVDYLPRAILAQDVAGGRKLLVNEDPAGYQVESLEALGYPRDRLLPIAAQRAVRPRSVIVPSLLASTTVPHKGLPRLMQDAFPPTGPAPAERIYISRADTARRRLANEPELIALLERYGFRSYVTGAMSFEAQRNLFYGAKAVVAVHGAALANLLFSNPGCDVIEIASVEYRPTFFNVLALVCRHRHAFAPARVIAPAPNGDPMNGTWEADLDAIEAALAQRFGSA